MTLKGGTTPGSGGYPGGFDKPVKPIQRPTPPGYGNTGPGDLKPIHPGHDAKTWIGHFMHAPYKPPIIDQRDQ